HHNLPHQPSCHSEKEYATLPPNRLALNQPDERLVNERARLHGMTPALASQMAPRERPKLLVHDRHEPFQRRLAALAPVDQQVREFFSWSGQGIWVRLRRICLQRPE